MTRKQVLKQIETRTQELQATLATLTIKQLKAIWWTCNLPKGDKRKRSTWIQAIIEHAVSADCFYNDTIASIAAA